MLTINDQNQLLCAGCGFEYTHCESVESFEQSDEDFNKNGVHVTVKGYANISVDCDMSGNPSYRRDGVKLTFWCEGCNKKSILTVAQHKGNTFVEYVVRS